MKVGNREFSGKGAREDCRECSQHGRHVMEGRQDDEGSRALSGFEILIRGCQYKDGRPDLYVRGKATYEANLNPESPAGTTASIDHVLRSLDRRAEEEQREVERQEKTLTDYKAQLGKQFEHEERLKDLLAKQAQLNAMLDLDKHEAQVVAETDGEKALPAGFAAKVTAENRAVEMAQ